MTINYRHPNRVSKRVAPTGYVLQRGETVNLRTGVITRDDAPAPHVTIPDPDDPWGCPGYDGPADLAWTRLPTGAYWCSSGDTSGVLLVISSADRSDGGSSFVPTVRSQATGS